MPFSSDRTGPGAAPAATDKNLLVDASPQLRHDKFSLVVNVFRLERLPLLRRLLKTYARSPVLHKVYLVWNSQEPPPPEASWGLHVPVEAVTHPVDRLTNRFKPLKTLETVGVLIADDDIEVEPDDLALAFEVFRRNEDHLVGIYPRGFVEEPGDNGAASPRYAYKYEADSYSMMLTKFMFVHHKYLREYTFRMSRRVYDFVNAINNCEDIAMNFLVSSITKQGPVAVDVASKDYGDSRGYGEAVVSAKSVSLSGRTTHKNQRSQCLDMFAKEFGGMQLRPTSLHATRYNGEHALCLNGDDWVDCTKASISPAKRHPTSRFAYVTVLASDSPGHVLAVSCWAKRLRALGTTQDLVLLVTDDVDCDRHFEQLSAFSRIRPVQLLTDGLGKKKVQFTKLHVWELEEYDKVVYLDTDVLVLENLDHLFDSPDITAVPDVYTGHLFNSGVLVLRPNKATARTLIASKDAIYTYNKGDQGTLNQFFSGWFQSGPEHRLPVAYNFIKFFPEHYHPPEWFRQDTVESVLGLPKVVHFANPWFKPWLFTFRTEDTDPYVRLWWDTCSTSPSNFTEWHARVARESVPQTPQHFAGSAGGGSVGVGGSGSGSGSGSGGGVGSGSAGGVGGNIVLVRPTQGYGIGEYPKTLHAHENQAYVTYFNGGELPHAVVWTASLRRTGTRRRLVALAGPGVSVAAERLLRDVFDHVERVDAVPNPHDDHRFTVLRAFGLVKYTKLVFVDAASLFLENMDDLFSRPMLSATPAVFPTDKLSGLLLVLQPSRVVLDAMLARVHTLPSFDGSVAGFLNSFFHDWFFAPAPHRIPPTYHADMWFKRGMVYHLGVPKCVWFDPRWEPWLDLRPFAESLQNVRLLRAWWETFCAELPHAAHASAVLSVPCKGWERNIAALRSTGGSGSGSGSGGGSSGSSGTGGGGGGGHGDDADERMGGGSDNEGDEGLDGGEEAMDENLDDQAHFSADSLNSLDLDMLDKEAFDTPKLKVRRRVRRRKGE